MIISNIIIIHILLLTVAGYEWHVLFTSCQVLPDAPPDALDLIKKFLIYSSDKRISANKVSHPLLTMQVIPWKKFATLLHCTWKLEWNLDHWKCHRTFIYNYFIFGYICVYCTTTCMFVNVTFYWFSLIPSVYLSPYLSTNCPFLLVCVRMKKKLVAGECGEECQPDFPLN